MSIGAGVIGWAQSQSGFMGLRLLDEILTLAPPGPIHVSGVLRSILNEGNYLNCFITFSDGSTALIEMSKAIRLRVAERFHISCEKFDILVPEGEKGLFWLHQRMDGRPVAKERLPDLPAFHLRSRPYYRNVFAANRGEESLIVAPEQSRRYVATAEAFVKSGRERGTVLVAGDEDE